MGTTTFYLRHNDLKTPLDMMSQKEIGILSRLSPYSKDNNYMGWRVPFELHNGNVYILVFWKGRLMKLEEAPEILKNKYYSRYSGKTLREYEWTLLRRLISREIVRLDKEFKRRLRKRKQIAINNVSYSK